MAQYYRRYICLLLWAILSFIADPAMAADISAQRVRGICEYQRGQAQWMRIAPEMRLAEGDTVRTGWGSALTVTYGDGSMLQIGERTSVILHADGVPGSKSAIKGLVELIFGRLHMNIAPTRDAVRIRATTSTAVIGVRGTAFFLAADAKQTTVGVTNGTVTVANIKIPQKTVDVAAGMKTIVYAGLPPIPPVPLSSGEGKEGAGGGSALDRIEDIVVEETEQIPTEKFIAFCDVHIDAIRNPAYAVTASGNTTQVLGRMGTSHRSDSSTPDAFSINGAAVTDVSEKNKTDTTTAEVWATTFHPIPSGDVIGAFGAFQRQRTWDTTTYTGTAATGGGSTPFIQDGRTGFPDLNSRFQAADIGAVFAHPLSRFDAGILLRYHTSLSVSDFQYLLDLPGFPVDTNRYSARGTADLAEVILGVRRVAENGIEWGWSVGLTGSRSDIRDTDHFKNGAASPLQRTKESFDGWHTEVRARQQISDNWRWGASLRMIFLNGTGDLTDDSGLSFTESVHDRFSGWGSGSGIRPTRGPPSASTWWPA